MLTLKLLFSSCKTSRSFRSLIEISDATCIRNGIAKVNYVHPTRHEVVRVGVRGGRRGEAEDEEGEKREAGEEIEEESECS